ncbi:hypothetical protein CJU89_5710 [Yarrowia sp. B02]|nr:hypothetical protein CJU89_5710 [Yarrowia sp. B02]
MHRKCCHLILKHKDVPIRDATFTVRRKLLVLNDRSRYHIFSYLEDLRDGLKNSPLPATLKCRRLNNLLPPPWCRWFAEFNVDLLAEILTYLDEPLPASLTEDVALEVVDEIITLLTTFIDQFKSNPKISDDYFSKASWAPLRNSTAHANLLWQLEGPLPTSRSRKVTREDLMRNGFFTEDQFEQIYQATSGSPDCTSRGFYELLQVCHPYLNWLRGRLRRETDMKKLVGDDQFGLSQLGREGCLAAIGISLEAAGRAPFQPDDGSFSRLSKIFKAIGLEYVDDEVHLRIVSQ